jgi:methylenetetrahydrofolate--tRNA-(uracil-5-)-methyltransferase
MIPGLEQAEFARLGGIHRNSFINSPLLLDGRLRLKSKPNIRFAGQITGCEGYVESAAVGLIAARFAAAEFKGRPISEPPAETAIGGLLRHITGGADSQTFQPMNVNFGLMPPPEGRLRKADRKKAYTDRARAGFAEWLRDISQAAEAPLMQALPIAVE